MELKIKKLRADVKLPTYAHTGDAGFDIYIPDEVTIKAGEKLSIPLGLAMEIPDGYTGLQLDKSSLSHKHGLKSFGGVIDAGYRGEFHVGIINLSDKDYTFAKGDKIIQMLIMPVARMNIIEANELTESDRGTGAFGSSGK